MSLASYEPQVLIKERVNEEFRNYLILFISSELSLYKL